jgi:hypothetical protein
MARCLARCLAGREHSVAADARGQYLGFLFSYMMNGDRLSFGGVATGHLMLKKLFKAYLFFYCVFYISLYGTSRGWLTQERICPNKTHARCRATINSCLACGGEKEEQWIINLHPIPIIPYNL